MRTMKLQKLLLVVLLPIVLGLLLIHECAFARGMGATAKGCECAGYEWLLFDRSPSDGSRKTLCLGIVRATECYQYMDGPTQDCNFSSGVTLRTDKEIYAPGESIQLELINRLSGPISYHGFCSLNLCQYHKDKWFCEIKDCYTSMVVINSGSSIRFSEQAVDLVEASLKYQFEYQTFSDDTFYTIDSNEFTIQQE